MKNGDMENALKFQFDLLNYSLVSFNYGSWNHRNLKNRFWRLYRHDHYGAGIICSGKEIEFLPDCFYLIPPQITFSSWCRAKLTQFSVHFIINPLRGNRIYRVNATDELDILYHAVADTPPEKRNILRDKINLTALCASCIRKLPEDIFSQPEQEDVPLQIICGEINDFYQNPLSLKTVAASINMSKSSMNRIFRRKLSTSPYQYLLKRRYEYAARLLCTTDMTLKEICSIVSINDVYHFSRMFKQRYGMAPSTFRKQKKNLPE